MGRHASDELNSNVQLPIHSCQRTGIAPIKPVAHVAADPVADDPIFHIPFRAFELKV